MADLSTISRPVSTPTEDAIGDEISEKIAFVPVMRSGLGMVDGFIYAFPNAQVWHVGMYRDPKTLVPIEYYNRFTNETSCQVAYVLDATLSCGAVARAAVKTVKDWGVQKIKLVTFVSSAEGIKAFQLEHPDVDIITGAIDAGLGPQAPSVFLWLVSCLERTTLESIFVRVSCCMCFPALRYVSGVALHAVGCRVACACAFALPPHWAIWTRLGRPKMIA